MTDAFWYSMLGEHEKAIESLNDWLANSEQGELFRGIQTLWAPAFDPLRDDPRFEGLLQKIFSVKQ